MRFLITILLGALLCLSQVAITGRVVDETGAGVDGARVELRPAYGAAIAASSDRARSFRVTLPAAGDYTIKAERLGFYLFQGKPRAFDGNAAELTITLNHLQDFADKVDVVYSPPAIDPAQPAQRRELDNQE